MKQLTLDKTIHCNYEEEALKAMSQEQKSKIGFIEYDVIDKPYFLFRDAEITDLKKVFNTFFKSVMLPLPSGFAGLLYKEFLVERAECLYRALYFDSSKKKDERMSHMRKSILMDSCKNVFVQIANGDFDKMTFIDAFGNKIKSIEKVSEKSKVGILFNGLHKNHYLKKDLQLQEIQYTLQDLGLVQASYSKDFINRKKNMNNSFGKGSLNVQKKIYLNLLDIGLSKQDYNMERFKHRIGKNSFSILLKYLDLEESENNIKLLNDIIEVDNFLDDNLIRLKVD